MSSNPDDVPDPRHLPPRGAARVMRSWNPAGSGGAPWLCGFFSRRGCLCRKGFALVSTPIALCLERLEHRRRHSTFVVQTTFSAFGLGGRIYEGRSPTSVLPCAPL